MRRVCLIGAGSIARVHAEALRGMADITVVAVADPRRAAAEALARLLPRARAVTSAAEAAETVGFDAAHVLTPPDTHAAIALPLLEAGRDVLLEKPMAVSAAECTQLAAAAAASGAVLGVNQNFLFHPAFIALRRALASGRHGRPRFVDCVYSVPLRQLAAGQVGHWMFDAPVNILLEQAVHPLSQIAALIGSVDALEAIPDAPRILWEGRRFHGGWTASLQGAGMAATLRLAVGQTFPLWQITVVCDDGAVVADILGNRVHTIGRTRFADPIDGVMAPAAAAAGMVAGGVANAARYAASLAGLAKRNDPFFRSMQGSIAAFHAAPAHFEADAAFGARLVGLCEDIAARLPVAENRPAPLQAPATLAGAPDVALLGGTGFIGRATVARLLREGLSVAVMARGTTGLPPLFSGPRIRLQRGDIADAGAVAQAIAGAGAVVNLAHGGGGADYAAIRAAMVGGAETVARACLAAGTPRLLHVGSIASLYLGPGADSVDGTTLPDPQAEQRGDYARAKAECDLMLMGLHAQAGLPLVILRPGLVVGQGTSPFHSGLGFFNAEQHVIGWNRGHNPLPFVLVEDVAAAIFGALSAQDAVGRCYNLVGDVRPTAREYLAWLAEATGRPLRFHPKFPDMLLAEEGAKWLLKRLGGRRSPPPSRRDLMSRGLNAVFDCSDAKRDLAWLPEADSIRFRAAAFAPGP
ncbi:NAD-dependent epimerase/dehydratase family protein [Roseomonas sp. HJA6]|uniref:NAD-dependent epimerase/dehydratase family protein n=1 Tax=Roseomonas alba TaxID=2846776 RepID=A0ABS7A5E6_9PROT|nr:NAD-dependent epimerase/dehydratase family protein [Neoroseomonas alba]MBW6397542.1 NAD-dependent epimerase/dehydratase family protein [Neoroseomonas alba]